MSRDVILLVAVVIAAVYAIGKVWRVGTENRNVAERGGDCGGGL